MFEADSSSNTLKILLGRAIIKV
jgi:hypothetical protein